MRAAGLHGEQHLTHSCCSSAHPLGRQLSSTPLEILLFLNGWYYATYFLLEIFIFIYKGLLLPYPSANLALDLVMLFLYLGIEVTRIFFGWTRTKAPSRLFWARQGYALPQRLGPRPHIPSLHSWSDGSISAPWSRARPSHSLIPHQPLLGRTPPLVCPATWRQTVTRIPDLAPHEGGREATGSCHGSHSGPYSQGLDFVQAHTHKARWPLAQTTPPGIMPAPAMSSHFSMGAEGQTPRAVSINKLLSIACEK
ncbi:transmembrane protein 216 isoform X2 [Dermochelys coriacea]|uniref:transmembrane protein 216 isoform X2 n=1 Tax=Dermochelys coriacea TaxID=27794 RepID=UPI001CA9F243|nr:transmembrane protein 216 isoform X2 [Dermochelys coriacea]